MMGPAVSGRLPDFPWDKLTSYAATARAHPDGLVDLSVGTPVDPTPVIVQEALRVTKPGGTIALNFRSWAATDPLVLPVGAVIRALFRAPRLGGWLSRRRLPTRLAWQANRLDPHQVMRAADGRISAISIWRNPKRSLEVFGVGDATVRQFEGINPNHWWLVATVHA